MNPVIPLGFSEAQHPKGSGKETQYEQEQCNIHVLRVTDGIDKWLLEVNAGVNRSATIGVMNLMSSLLRTLERATYPIPLGTVGQSNHTISFLILAPWVLQMVVQYAEFSAWCTLLRPSSVVVVTG